jgi:protoporphyrin/coproporphyrin ferrochelatase
MIGILLINLGTPASPNTSDVRKYLREFLSDPRVMDLDRVLRWFLVNGIVAPFRAPKSAKAYQKIWGPNGSPLLHNTRLLAKALGEQLGGDFHVAMGMRYGSPSIASALDRLTEEGAQEIRILPLYPQYAASSTGTAEGVVLRWHRQRQDGPEIKLLPPFFDHPGFLKSFAEQAKPILNELKPEHVLFSFHGLPTRHILKEDISGTHCLQSEDCCEKIIPANGMCYRAHCFQSARGIAALLGIPQKNYTISFQSRLGKGWLEPFTDILLQQLPDQGVRRLAVFCPSFVADCLETLEEIGIRGREQFLKAGGRELRLIPSLNAQPHWVETVAKMVRG